MIRGAAELFARQGYESTSTRNLASLLGIEKATLYYHLEGKEDLLYAICKASIEQLIEDVNAAVEGIEDPLERLVAGLDAAALLSARHPEVWRALSDLSVLSLSDPALVEPCRALRVRFAAAIEAEARGALGRLPAYTLVSPRNLAAAIAAAIEGAALGSLVDGRDASAHFQALKVMVLSLVVAAYVTAAQEPPVARLAQLLRPR